MKTGESTVRYSDYFSNDTACHSHSLIRCLLLTRYSQTSPIMRIVLTLINLCLNYLSHKCFENVPVPLRRMVSLHLLPVNYTPGPPPPTRYKRNRINTCFSYMHICKKSPSFVIHIQGKSSPLCGQIRKEAMQLNN